MRDSYTYPGPSREWTISREMEHVTDFSNWANGFRPSAQAAEDAAKSVNYSSEQECNSSGAQDLIRKMMLGAQNAANESIRTRHANGRHQWVIP